MRTIKFRGKRIGNKEWVYGYLLTAGDKAWIAEGYYMTHYEVIPETVGQFTGLKDKNGKEVYEGDIIKTSNRLTMIAWTGNGFNGVYMNDDGTWDDQWEDQINRSYSIEMLGNIHDNPELLK